MTRFLLTGNTVTRTYLSRDVEVLAEVVNALRGEHVLSKGEARGARQCRVRSIAIRTRTHVVVLPREVGGQVAARGERLARLDDEEVLDIEVLVLDLEVLLRNENTVYEDRSVSVLALAGRADSRPELGVGRRGDSPLNRFS